MRWYWTRIAIAALAIFGVGYAGLSLVRSAQGKVEQVVHSASDLSFPLPFVSFVFDGAEAGKFRRLVLHRSGPDRIRGIALSVRVSDPAALAALTGDCHLTVDNPRNLGRNTSFRCVEVDSTMEDFGGVTVQGRDQAGNWVDVARVPLVLPRQVISELGGTDVTESIAGAEADEIRALADSIGAVSVRLGQAGSDAERSELTRELRRLRLELREIERAVTEVTRARVRARAGGAQVKVDVNMGDVPPGAGPPTPKG